MAEGQALLNPVFVRFVHGGRPAEIAAALGPLALAQMPSSGARAHHFAGCSDLKPLRGGFLCLNAFGASHINSLSLEKERAI
jgi:hypothetical protein